MKFSSFPTVRLALIIFLLSPNLVFAQKAGDRVIAKSEVTLRLSEKIVETVARDTVLEVEKTNGPWLWVKSPSGKKGWVKNTEVVEAPPDLPPGSREDPKGNNERRPTVAGTGTAFVIHPDGYLITNAHVVRPSEKGVFEVENAAITVTLDGKEYKAELRAIDKSRDLALLKIDAKGLSAMPLADSDKVQLNESVHVLGFPRSTVLGRSLKVNPGAITGIDDSRHVKSFQTSATVNKGNSGGPLVNERGEVVGVVVAVFTFEGDVGQCIPINYARQLAEKESIRLPKSNAKEKIDAVNLVKKVAPSVGFVRMDSLQWSFKVDTEHVGRGVLSVAFSPSGKLLGIISDHGNSVNIWDPFGPRRLLHINVDDGNVRQLAFSPDEKYLGWAGGIGATCAVVWDLQNNKLAFSCKNPAQDIVGGKAIAFAPDNKFFVIGENGSSKNKTFLATVWQLPNGSLKHKLAHSANLEDVAVSPDSRLILTRDANHTYRVWNAGDGSMRYSLDGPRGNASFSIDGSRLIVWKKGITRDAALCIYNVLNGQEIRKVEGLGGNQWGIPIKNERFEGVCVFDSHWMGAFDLDGKRLFRSYWQNFGDDNKRKGYLYSTVVSDEGSHIAAGHLEGWVTIWNVDYLVGTGQVKETAIAELNKRGCDYYETNGSIHVPSSQILDDEFWGFLHDANAFGGVRSVTLSREHALTPALWRRLAQFRNLREFVSYNKELGGKRLQGISQLSKLADFKAHVSDDDLDHLTDMKLTYLSMDGSPITDEGLKRLAKMDSLTSIRLSGTKITNAGLVHLKGLTNLRYLSVGQTQVSDESAKQLLSAILRLKPNLEKKAVQLRASKEREEVLRKNREIREKHDEEKEEAQRKQRELLKELDELLKKGRQ